MAKIAYPDKVKGDQFFGTEATEVKDVVNANDTDRTTNTTNIATNATNIGTNTTNIATNATDIGTNVTDINTLQSQTEPNTWYVNTNGNDANVGSDKFPFENISAAIAVYAAGDIIRIIDEGYSSNENITIDKKTTIVGPVANITGGAAFTQLQGTWTIDGSGISIIFENLTTKINWSSVVAFDLDVINGAVGTASSFPARLTDLLLHNSFYSLGASSELRSLECHACIGTGSDVKIGRSLQLHATEHTGNITGGLDSSSTVTLKNSSIDGNLTNTGTLIQENSTIGGTRAVSGTTTSRQAKVFDDSVEFKQNVNVLGDLQEAGTNISDTYLDKVTASDQTVASNVFFTKNVLADKLAANVATQLNALDIGGGAAIGSSYAGIKTAPTNGLIVEGNAGFGIDNPGANVDISSISGGKLRLSRNDISVIADEVVGEITFHTNDTNDTNENAFIRVLKNNVSAVGTVPMDITFLTGVEGSVSEAMRIAWNGNVSIGIIAAAAKVDINQASGTAAIPVLKLTQADISEEIIEFDPTTIGIGNPIEAIGAKSFAQTHFLKVFVVGLGVKHVPMGDLS